MDKDRRIRRYRRKDYSEMVDFPVEIVGRDGQVRRYDFDESIRLYQRRLTFAPIRFHDDDLVAAEQGHCRARIEQLRRSYFHLFGWSGDGPAAGSPEHAGELVSLLMRALRARERLDLRFSRLADDAGDGELWFVERAEGAAPLLLYTFVFDGDDGDAAQAAFARRLADLRSAGDCGGDAERVVAWRHASDCGFILTGRGEDVGTLAALVSGEDGDGGMEPTPWDELVAFVRRGDLPTAFLRARWLVAEQPWHRDAYAVGAALALLLRRALDAEDLAVVGASYARGDALLLLYGALARLQQGRPSDAEALLRQAAASQRPLQAATNALAWLLIARGRLVPAIRALLASAPAGTDAGDLAVRRELLVEAVGTLTALSFGVGALAVAMVAAKIHIALPLASCALMGLWVAREHRALRALGHRIRYEDPEVILRRVETSRA